jgi:hypothetical protein
MISPRIKASRIKTGVSTQTELEPDMRVFSQTKDVAVLIRLKFAMQESTRV